MAERTKGKIAIFRDHPDSETAAELVHIRAAGPRDRYLAIADVYCARAGSEQEANAEFIVTAWNAHDTLVAALRKIARTKGSAGVVAQKALADAGLGQQ